MITMKEMETFNDRAIITIIKMSKDRGEVNRATTVLLNRYRNQLIKNYKKMCCHLQNTDRVKNYESEFYSRAYEYFWKAVCAINLDKIKDDNWKFVGYLDLFMRSCRKFASEELVEDGSRCKAIDSLNDYSEENNISADPDVEEAYWNNGGWLTEPCVSANSICALNELEKALKEYEDADVSRIPKDKKTEYLVVKGLLEGKAKRDIAKELGMAYGSIYYAADRAYTRLKKLIED